MARRLHHHHVLIAALCIALCCGVHSFSYVPTVGTNRFMTHGNNLLQSSLHRTISKTMMRPRLETPSWVQSTQARRRGRPCMLSSATQEQPQVDTAAETPPARTAVVGSGPAGLATAIMLARRGWKNIVLYDRLPRLPKSNDEKFWEENERAYNIGLDLRGQNALKRFGCWERVESCTADVTGRIDWVPGADAPRETDMAKARGYTTKIIQRDRLAGCLLEEIEAKYADAIRVEFNAECKSVTWSQQGEGRGGEGTARLVLQQRKAEGEGGVEKRWEEEVDLLVGADGVNSNVKRFEDENVRVYKTITMRPQPGQKLNLNYSARTSSDINLDALPTREGTLIAVVLFRPDDARITGARTGAAVRQLFKQNLPMFDPMLSDAACEAFARKPVSSLPVFQFCGPVLHKGGATVLLGDAIHAVKPFFGLGVNSAFEDISELDRCLSAKPNHRQGALELFSKRRGKEAKAIVEVSQAFDRPGWWGFVSFVLPIIVDSICAKLLPGLFKPNFLTYTKNPDVTFAQARRRKSLDRLLQSALFSLFLLGVPWALALAFRSLRAALLGA